MVTRSTFGCDGQRDSSACSSRDAVLLPTATLPAIPMTNGTRGVSVPRKVAVAACRLRVAARIDVGAGFSAGPSEDGPYTNVSRLRHEVTPQAGETPIALAAAASTCGTRKGFVR